MRATVGAGVAPGQDPPGQAAGGRAPGRPPARGEVAEAGRGVAPGREAGQGVVVALLGTEVRADQGADLGLAQAAEEDPEVRVARGQLPARDLQGPDHRDQGLRTERGGREALNMVNITSGLWFHCNYVSHMYD